jgi:hypothetical protein
MNGFSRALGIGLIGIVILAGVAACQVGPLNIVNGSGKLRSEARSVRGFNEVEISGAGTLTVEQGATETLTIEADDNIVPLLTSNVNSGRLVLGTKRNTLVRPAAGIHYRLTVKDLRAVRSSGSARVEAATLQSERFTIDTSGSSDIAIGQLTATTLAVETSGSGNITVAGSITGQTIKSSGSCNYHAADLASKTARLEVSGNGDATVRASDTLDVEISGAARIGYIGTPRVTSDISGSGKVQRVEGR